MRVKYLYQVFDSRFLILKLILLFFYVFVSVWKQKFEKRLCNFRPDGHLFL